MAVMEVKLVGLERFNQEIAWLVANFPGWLAEANRATAEAVRDNAKQALIDIDAYDTHELHDSVQIYEAAKGLRVAVYSDARHAPAIEFGSAPHFPPLDKIRAWCGRKGIPESAAYPIARKIAERGTPERPWLYPAFTRAMQQHLMRIRAFVGAPLAARLPRSKAA